MFLLYGDLEQCYAKIKEDALNRDCSILIFVSTDIDSICSTKILLSLLKSDFLSFKLVPVLGYDDLAKANEELVANSDEIKSVIFINCGGMVDLGDFFDFTDEMIAYVIDTHRPIHLKNLYEHEKVVIIGDPALQAELKDVKVAFSQMASEDESDEEEEEEKFEDDENDGLRSAKRRRLDDESESKRALAHEARRVIADYYSSCWYGSPSTRFLYSLANDQSKNSNELLWLAIVGLTDHYVHERITPDGYRSLLAAYHKEVQKFNQEDIMGTQEAVIDSDTTIKYVDDYRFMLYRHWTLYDSMYHSPYVATRLGIWKETGRKKLQTMLARLGLPLVQCNQKFANMDINVKKLLREKIETISPQFRLDDILFESFVKQIGYKIQISASDVVYAVTALLEATYFSLDPTDNVQAEIKELESDGKGARDEIWVKNFYKAFDALNDIGILQKGLELSMKFQQAIVEQGTSIIEKKAITSTRLLRFTVLKDTPNLFLFSHPLTLTRLACFLADAFRESGKTETPVVVAAYNEITGTYLAVGVTDATLTGQENRRNKFNLAFREAAEKSRAQIKHDGFDTEVIEIGKTDVTKFLETLHSIIGKYRV